MSVLGLRKWDTKQFDEKLHSSLNKVIVCADKDQIYWLLDEER